MSYDPYQFRRFIDDTLKAWGHGLYSAEAVALLMGTAAVESEFGRYLYQLHGPAVSPYQIEPATFVWLRDHYADAMPELKNRLFKELVYDLRLSTIMARLRYRVVIDPLPVIDPQAMGEYWKTHYNTAQGGGTVPRFVGAWKRFVAPVLDHC